MNASKRASILIITARISKVSLRVLHQIDSQNTRNELARLPSSCLVKTWMNKFVNTIFGIKHPISRKMPFSFKSFQWVVTYRTEEKLNTYSRKIAGTIVIKIPRPPPHNAVNDAGLENLRKINRPLENIGEKAISLVCFYGRSLLARVYWE